MSYLSFMLISKMSLLIQEYLPQLEQDYLKQQNLPQIYYFSGDKGYQTVFDMLYLKGSHKNIYILINDLEQYEPYEPKYIFSIEKRGLKTHLYVNQATGIDIFLKRDEKEFRQTKQVATPILHDTIVFEDKVVFGKISKKDFNVLVIKNYEFVKTYKSLLKLL